MMPNWCTCELEIAGERHYIVNLLEAANEDVGKNKNAFSLQKLVPMPESVPEEQGNEWRVDNWGTKWDIVSTLDDQGEIIFLKFESAWSPPIEAIEKISKNYPTLSFCLTYEEPGMDFFGISKFQNGLIEEVQDSYDERFAFNMDFYFSKATIEGDNVVIPFLMARMDDPYSTEAQFVETQCILTFPLSLDEDDIEDQFEETVVISSEDNIMEEMSIKRHEIIEKISESFEEIKATAQHNVLNASLPVNEEPKSNKRKI